MSARRIHLECKTQKQGCYQNHGIEVWVRMCNIPMKILYKRSHCFDNAKEALNSKEPQKPTSEENLYLLLSFL
jgi:uncharacterized protein (DUF39 family)